MGRRRLFLVLAMIFCSTMGLLIIKSGRAADPAGPRPVTFNKDVASIFFKNCAECHRPGEGAPFSVLSFKDARPWAKSIREQVVSRQMPPWHADPHYGEFKNNRTLTQSEIETIVAWVESGAPEGEPKDLPPAPTFADGWNIGRPDQVISLPEEYTYRPGTDEYQYFDVPTNFTEDKYVTMVEARPGNRKIVHHIIAYIVPPGSPNTAKLTTDQRYQMLELLLKNTPLYRDGYLLRLRPEQPVIDNGCETPNGGRGSGNSDSSLTGYAPGHNADIFPPGVVKRIPAGSHIRFQIHYSNQTLGGQAVEKDRSMVGMIFAKEPAAKLMSAYAIGNILFKIPAGAENHQVTACRLLRRETTIYSLMPHMHLRGKSMEYRAIYPDGQSEILLNVPNYNFGWQTNYQLKEPKRLPQGTRLVVTAHFDNSAKNRFNPDPTKDVRYGEPTSDEMMFGFVDGVAEMPPVAQIDPKLLDPYPGKYEVLPNVTATVTRQGSSLVVQIPLRGKMEFLPLSENRFFLKNGDADLTFVKNEQGEVTEARIEGSGISRYKRIKEAAPAGGQ
ncbi:MAG TPA: DUF3471 domain-containing protein [Blastocatellia bacterium]|nr:DUF3471 domain-containing protein [Blastocatellia bacterium]